MSERWLTRSEAAEVSQSTPGWIERLAKRGKIKRQKDGNSYRYAYDDVAAVLKLRKERGYKTGSRSAGGTARAAKSSKVLAKNGTHAKGSWLPLAAVAEKLGVRAKYIAQLNHRKDGAFRRGKSGSFLYNVKAITKWRAELDSRTSLKKKTVEPRPIGWKKMAASATERLRRARFTIEALDMKVMSTDEVLAKLRVILFADDNI